MLCFPLRISFIRRKLVHLKFMIANLLSNKVRVLIIGETKI